MSRRPATFDRIKHLQQRIVACEGVQRAGVQIRPHVEALRAEAETPEDLEAVAAVSDTVARWEGYGRHANRFRRLLSAAPQRGADPARRAAATSSTRQRSADARPDRLPVPRPEVGPRRPPCGPGDRHATPAPPRSISRPGPVTCDTTSRALPTAFQEVDPCPDG